MLTEEQITENRATLLELQVEHHDLDQVIDPLIAHYQALALQGETGVKPVAPEPD